MKLYLSSLMLGDHGNRLLEMTGVGARMAVITNALDYIPLEAQLEYTRTELDIVSYFTEAGFDPSLIDLRYYFGRSAQLRTLMLRYQVIWAVGGNAFLLRRAMRESGFDQIIDDILAADVVYAGWSAGACVAGDSLQAIAFMDDPNVTAPGYSPGEPICEGLGLVPYTIIPHFRSAHPEAAAAEKASEWVTARRVQHRTLQDGDVLLANGGEAILLKRRADE
ncbi:MAG TPA: Type 1 glutamine amidotransferase-like domain-containing protein [Allosphingosinicella sp.]